MTLGGLSSACFLLQQLSDRGSSSKAKGTGATSAEFRAFQRNYIFVYLVIMLSDWLQGTNMFTLYQSYGVDISTLFVTGFASSAVFSMFIGPLVFNVLNHSLVRRTIKE